MGNWLYKEGQVDDPSVATWPHTCSYYYLGVVDQGCKHLWLHLSIAAKITLDGWESGCNSEELQAAPLTQPAGGDLMKNTSGRQNRASLPRISYKLKWPHWSLPSQSRVKIQFSLLCWIKQQYSPPPNIFVMGHGRWLSVLSWPQRTTKESSVSSSSLLNLMKFAGCSFSKQPWGHKCGSCLSLWLEVCFALLESTAHSCWQHSE